MVQENRKEIDVKVLCDDVTSTYPTHINFVKKESNVDQDISGDDGYYENRLVIDLKYSDNIIDVEKVSNYSQDRNDQDPLNVEATKQGINVKEEITDTYHKNNITANGNEDNSRKHHVSTTDQEKASGDGRCGSVAQRKSKILSNGKRTSRCKRKTDIVSNILRDMDAFNPYNMKTNFSVLTAYNIKKKQSVPTDYKVDDSIHLIWHPSHPMIAQKRLGNKESCQLPILPRKNLSLPAVMDLNAKSVVNKTSTSEKSLSGGKLN